LTIFHRSLLEVIAVRLVVGGIEGSSGGHGGLFDCVINKVVSPSSSTGWLSWTEISVQPAWDGFKTCVIRGES
jgi:hypothetical protein